MNRYKHFVRSASGLLILLSVFTLSVYGQEDGRAGRMSFWITRSLVKPQLSSTYRTLYSPPFDTGEYSSSASQALSLTARDAAGTSLGLAVGINKFMNIVFQMDWTTTDLTGVNSPYEISLNYTSTPPPDYTPSPVSVAQTTPWPDTVGKIRHLVLSLNLQGKVRLLRTIMLEASAGLTYFSLSGDASSLGFNNFWLGGHSVLFSNHYRIRMVFGPKGTVGGNVGIGLEIPLIRPLYLYFGGQVFLSPKLQLNPTLDFILNSREIIQEIPLDVIENRMSLQPLELNPGKLQILFGVRLRF
jgi:hypothetical protein